MSAIDRISEFHGLPDGEEFSNASGKKEKRKKFLSKLGKIALGAAAIAAPFIPGVGGVASNILEKASARLNAKKDELLSSQLLPPSYGASAPVQPPPPPPPEPPPVPPQRPRNPFRPFDFRRPQPPVPPASSGSSPPPDQAPPKQVNATYIGFALLIVIVLVLLFKDSKK